MDWKGTVDLVKLALDTEHGRRGYKAPDTMFFAVPSSREDNTYWIQVDLKVCFKKEMFEWEVFRSNYASGSKILGSILKPLGLVIDPEGIHIRVKGLEDENNANSMVWLSRDPKDLLRIMRLDRRILEAGFETKQERKSSYPD